MIPQYIMISQIEQGDYNHVTLQRVPISWLPQISEHDFENIGMLVVTDTVSIHMLGATDLTIDGWLLEGVTSDYLMQLLRTVLDNGIVKFKQELSQF